MSELDRAIVGPTIGAKIDAYCEEVSVWAEHGYTANGGIEIARAELERAIANALDERASEARNEGFEAGQESITG